MADIYRPTTLTTNRVAKENYMAELVRYSNEHRVVPLRTARLAAENV